MSQVPRLFSTQPFDEAVQRAATEGKWVLIDFTAGWCGPCQHMEKTTWAAPEVEAWVAAKAIAVQVDVDAQQELARRFHVQAMPTMVVVKAGEELDRAVGAQSAAQLLKWLGGLEQGTTLLDAQREQAKDGGPSERLHLAQELHARGKLPEAAEHALWVWEHALAEAPEFVGVRHSYLVELLKELVFEVPALKARLVELRDAAEDKATSDFLSLNRVLGSPERTLAWFERVQGKDAQLERHQELVQLLVERNRWAELGRLFVDPVATFERQLEVRDQARNGPVPEQIRDQLLGFLDQSIRQNAAMLIRATTAAGRDAVAEKVRARALEVDGSEEMKRVLGG